ncbi:hypothetical protein TWF225_008995 [Orbilia oligospora]|uniref:Uncharacterized protein n=1 Tax=Orbilia oligospora TaxID=2813651 RepID=A0A7C8K9C1_ORBOL|nr:hypothetical protein TWF751_008959 [Orbilia oligospora]KAF3175503.1 hypothetical protein TWF225_008995 [Orbilia oligospora]KAF3240602.1 hypothetical protein TWF217_000777 [Orbilia oligospora]KAF3251954.1 hypothetical protein TWF128_006803 [Orbilia oligospora]KAF3278074.1 hypothetical protein TWF132_001259 [Orbilia oligospora]
MGRPPAKETIQRLVKLTWDYIFPLTPTTSRPLHDFYNSLDILNSNANITTAPRPSEESIEDDMIIVTITTSRAIEKKLVPEGTKFTYGDMVLRSYVPKDKDLGEVVEEWRKVGDVIVRKVGGREEEEEKFGYSG